jgi:hypothetical protein
MSIQTRHVDRDSEYLHSIDPTRKKGPRRMVCAAPDYSIKDVFLVRYDSFIRKVIT